MEDLKKQLFTGWSFVRVIRLLMSAAIIYMSIAEKNWLFGLLGGLVLYQVLTNTGCCAGTCAVPMRKSSRRFNNTVTDKKESL